MINAADIVLLASFTDDSVSANMLAALIGGQPRTAGELAQATGVTVQTVGGHLTRLVNAGLVTAERHEAPSLLPFGNPGLGRWRRDAD